MENMPNVCSCPHHSVVPVIVMAFGLVFLLGYWGILTWTAVEMLWPLLVILGGFMKWAERGKMCKCC